MGETGTRRAQHMQLKHWYPSRINRTAPAFAGGAPIFPENPSHFKGSLDHEGWVSVETIAIERHLRPLESIAMEWRREFGPRPIQQVDW